MIVCDADVFAKQGEHPIIARACRCGRDVAALLEALLKQSARHLTAVGGDGCVTCRRKARQALHHLIRERLIKGQRIVTCAALSVSIAIRTHGEVVNSVLLLRTGSGDLDLQAQGQSGTGHGHIVFIAVCHEGVVATAIGAVHVTIGLVQAGLRAIHHDEHLELVNVRTAVLHIALAAGIKGDEHIGQAGDVDVVSVEDLVTRAVLIVVEQVRIAGVLDQLRNAVGHDHTGRSQSPIAIGWDIGGACMAQV